MLGLRVVRQLVPAQHKPALFPGFEATLRKKNDELRCEGQSRRRHAEAAALQESLKANLAAALLDEPAVYGGRGLHEEGGAEIGCREDAY